MKPYVIENQTPLAESEQQTAQSVFDTFSLGKPLAIFVGFSLVSLASPYAIMFVAVGDVNPKSKIK